VKQLIVDLAQAQLLDEAAAARALADALAASTKTGGRLVVVSTSRSLAPLTAAPLVATGLEAVNLLSRRPPEIDVRPIADAKDARTVAVTGKAADDLWFRVLDRFKELAKEGVTRAILDLSAVTGASDTSSAVAIAALAQQLREKGGGLAVVARDPRLKDGLTRTSVAGLVPVLRTSEEATPLLETLRCEVPKPEPSPAPRPPAVLARLDEARPEGTLALPSGELVACDFLEAANTRSSPSVYEGPTFPCPTHSCEVFSLLDQNDLAAVIARLDPAKPVRWEHAGKFDNTKARFASLADPRAIADARAVPDFFTNNYFPWIDALLARGAASELRKLGNAFVFYADGEGTSLPVFAGRDEQGRLVAVAIDVAPR
jgi:anti-anti-sigma regulatory factor